MKKKHFHIKKTPFSSEKNRRYGVKAGPVSGFNWAALKEKRDAYVFFKDFYGFLGVFFGILVMFFRIFWILGVYFLG
jgi:hypothetical protein